MVFAMPNLSFLAGLKQLKLKSILWPFLWSILFLGFLYNTLHTYSPSISSTTSLPASLANKVGEYHDALTHSNPVMTTDIENDFVTADIKTSSKVAVIIETRKYTTIIPLILHFAAVLGPDWPIIIYTNSENFGTFSTSQALLRYQKAGRIHIRALEEGTYFSNLNSVSSFMTKKWLWQDLAPAEHVLIFQSDSIICSNSVRSVEDFFEWDLIGAPLVAKAGKGYNGGLSVRNRNTTLRALEEWDWNNGGPEDQWFYEKFEIFAQRDKDAGKEDGVKLPSYEIARTFAVETIDYPSPLGLHQPTRFFSAESRQQSLEDWCPEYKLATTDRITA